MLSGIIIAHYYVLQINLKCRCGFDLLGEGGGGGGGGGGVVTSQIPLDPPVNMKLCWEIPNANRPSH